MISSEAFTDKEINLDYNSKINIMHGIIGTIGAQIVSPYYAKFAERLGATDYQIGYLTSLPHLISIFAFIPGAMLIESIANKKSVIGSTMLLNKLFFLLIAFIPFLKVDQATVFVLMIGLMNLFGSIGNMGYQSSIGDIFRVEDRGQAMGNRNRFSSFTGIIVTLISGKLLTLPKNNNDTIILYQWFFILAFIFSLIEVIYFFKFKGLDVKNSQKSKFIESMKIVLKEIPSNKKFIIFTLSSMFFHIGWIGAQPLFSLYTLRVLNANEFWLSALAIISGTFSMIAYTKWPEFAKKKGNNIAMTIAIIGMGLTPLFYTISYNIYILAFFHIIIGTATAGTVLLLFNVLLEVIPNEHSTIYIAIYNTIIAIIAGISPILGVKLLSMTNIYIALIAVGLIRLSSSFLFHKIK